MLSQSAAVRKGIYFKIKFMIEYISSTNKIRHFLWLNIWIKVNFRSHSVTVSIKKVGKNISHLNKISHFLPTNFAKLMKIHFVFFKSSGIWNKNIRKQLVYFNNIFVIFICNILLYCYLEINFFIVTALFFVVFCLLFSMIVLI